MDDSFKQAKILNLLWENPAKQYFPDLKKKFNSRSRVTNFITFMRQSHTEQQFFVPDFIFLYIYSSSSPSSLLLPLLSAFTSLAGAGDLHAVGVDQKWSPGDCDRDFPLMLSIVKCSLYPYKNVGIHSDKILSNVYLSYILSAIEQALLAHFELLYSIFAFSKYLIKQ